MSARSDLVGGALWATFGAVILVEALRMDRFEAMGASLYTMPGLVPGLLGAALVALGALLALRARRAAPAADGEPSAPLLNRRVLLTLLLCLAYAALAIGRVPFALSTALFVAAFTALFTPPEVTALRRFAVALASGVLTAAAVVYVFQHLFLVRLP